MVYPVGLEVADIDDDIGVQFQYLIGGHNQTFAVSREALEDHFGLALAGFSAPDRNHAILRAFMHGWERIRDAAARSRSVPSNQRIVLKSSDF
ncbi:DUF1488 family protein [Cupriavidus sp. USMAA2-4]|uniref:DUF1488 family protein n=1 Tax=Cupriavidus sp. USMAA2-4 TaxID=876364 RepID=UPI001E2E3BA4|nr:DUF1488 family protein [Cupriavidus sp. USMAA2-4]